MKDGPTTNWPPAGRGDEPDPLRHSGRGGGGKGSEGEGDDCCDGSEYGGSGEVAAKMTAMAATQPGKMEAVACRALSVENAGIAGWGRGRT